MGSGPGVYFDFSTASFHVPSVLSAPKAATVLIARTINVFVKAVRICQAPLNFGERGCLRSNGPLHRPDLAPLAGNHLALTAPDSFPVDQLREGCYHERRALG